MNRPEGERIMALEVRVGNLEDKVDAMNGKLDDLLALKNKGAGAFWLASALMGTGIVSFVLTLFNYFSGSR